MDEIQIIFSKETAYGVYQDALYFPADQVPSEEELERLKQERVDNWIAVITAPQMEVLEDIAEEIPRDG
jgi:hypothetical protein